ncbi:MAG: YceI family protein [Pedosphaera sp.]|nr:YceI family protein [Pedosphaera sp.]
MTTTRIITSSITFAVATFLAGCSDPSDTVHKSSGSAPQSAGSAPAGAGKDFVVRAESKIGFVGSKVTGSHSGGFTNFSGTIQVAGGKIVGSPEIKIAMQSTWTDNDRLTGHLKSPDFFDAEKFPVSTFTITSIEATAEPAKITGNFNLHGVTKSVSFPAQVQVSANSVGVKADFAINRKDFNINFPGKPNDLIRDNVVIKLDLNATPGAARPQDQTVK